MFFQFLAIIHKFTGLNFIQSSDCRVNSSLSNLIDLKISWVDVAGTVRSPRQLSGRKASFRTKGITNEYCVSFLSLQTFGVSVLKFSSQCFDERFYSLKVHETDISWMASLAGHHCLFDKELILKDTSSWMLAS